MFFNNITSNPLDEGERFERSMMYWTVYRALHVAVLQPLEEVSLNCQIRVAVMGVSSER